MGVKLLVINGSPKGKRSNTYRLTQAFTSGIQEIDAHYEYRESGISSMDIRPCLGCFACWNQTPGKCCLSDDMSALLADLLWADTIVWSFPLYYFSVPGPLKNFIDRQLPLSLPFMSAESESGGHPSRYDMSGKRHVLISTCGFYTARGNYDSVNAMFDHICGKGNYTTLYCGQGELFRVKELSKRTDEYLSFVCKAGREFAGGGITSQTKGKLDELLYPREVFETMADASWGVEKTGETSEESLVFTRQMAALYNKQAYSGKDLVLEMDYTDIGRRYQIILGKDGSSVLAEGFHTATTIIHTPYSVWKQIASGEISGEDALMQHLYRVQGDFNLMIHWDRYFGPQEQKVKTAGPEKRTNMTLLLLPWIAFWVATAATEVRWGAMIAIAISVLTPLIFFKCRMLIFDHISAAGVTLCGLMLILGISLDIVLPVSYLGFGILWTVNGFTHLPLTAHYSVNDYGGEGMLTNPLFIQTNRILTLCWGVLYLLMTLWTAILLYNDVEWVATVNSLLPMAMSFFTIWFQKWYPAKVARGNE